MRRFLAVAVILTGALTGRSSEFSMALPRQAERFWPGPELWANPLPDWHVANGELVCDFPGGNRNVVVLTHELNSTKNPFLLRAVLDQRSEGLQPRGGFVGFLVGLQGRFGDYRDSAVSGRGFAAGLHLGGRLFIGDTLDREATQLPQPFRNLTLELRGTPSAGTYRLTIRVLSPQGSELARLTRDNVDPSWLQGLVAVAVSTEVPGEPNLAKARPEFTKTPAIGTHRTGSATVAFREFSLSGNKFTAHPERAFGPILWTQYSLQNNGTLKLMAQFPPLGEKAFEARLELDGKPAGVAAVEPSSCTALFRVGGQDTSRNHSYRILFQPENREQGEFAGRIRRLPWGPKITVAAMSCNDGTGFPHDRLVENVASHKPDFLAFLGDQIYEGNGGYGVLYQAGDRSIVDYLRKYYLHGWAWRDFLREIPTVAIPDDHDAFHGNLWGNGGRAVDTSRGLWAEAQDQGGYKMPPEFVNVVHRTQAGNLPDPFDPTPCDQGISVYYTRWQFGPVDFAIVADRQWKTAPAPLLPEADIYNGFVRNERWDPRTQAHHPDAQLLGARQEAFLRAWAADRGDDTKFRVVLSQTPWNCMGTLPEGENRSDRIVPRLPILAPGEYPTNDVMTIDFDSNGWAQDKRNLALDIMKEAGVLLHIAGDQHLGSTGRYGIEQWNDGPYWIATPAIANLWPRR